MWATKRYLFLILHQPVTIAPYFISSSLQRKQKLRRFKDYLYLSRAVEPPFFSSFEMIPISTNLYHRIHKYPASSKNVFLEKRESKAIQERKS